VNARRAIGDVHPATAGRIRRRRLAPAVGDRRPGRCRQDGTPRTPAAL